MKHELSEISKYHCKYKKCYWQETNITNDFSDSFIINFPILFVRIRDVTLLAMLILMYVCLYFISDWCSVLGMKAKWQSHFSGTSSVQSGSGVRCSQRERKKAHLFFLFWVRRWLLLMRLHCCYVSSVKEISKCQSFSGNCFSQLKKNHATFLSALN